MYVRVPKHWQALVPLPRPSVFDAKRAKFIVIVSSCRFSCVVHGSLFTVHYLRWRMPPFMRQCWGLPHRLAQCMSPQGWGELFNAALLSLIIEACTNVCCATLLSSELVGLAYVQARSSNPRGRACRPKSNGSGRRGYWVTLYLFIYTARFLLSVFL